MKKKRVLHLLVSNSYSGAENVVCSIIENNLDYDMFYCSLDGPIRDILNKKKISFVPLSRISIREVRKVIKDYQIDIIHAHDFQASVLAVLSGFKGKIISHIHCNPSFIKTWNFYSFFYSMVSKKFSSIVFVSEQCLGGTVFLEKIKDKVVVIHNVVDAKRIEQLSCERDAISSDLVFLGRMVDLKQPQLVIEITNLLKMKMPDIQTIMIGDGKLLDECKNLVNQYQLENNVKFLGFQENPFSYVKNSKVAVMPSKYEGLGMSAIECMTLGIPVLNSGQGGLLEIFRHHFDFICNSKEEYVQKVMDLFTDVSLYRKYQRDCQKIVKDFVDVDSFIQKINQLYK